MPTLRSVVLTASTILGASGACPGQTLCTSGPPFTLGTVTVLATKLPSQSRLPRTTDDFLQVDAPGLGSVALRVQVSQPNPAATFRGTVVMQNGAWGNGPLSGETGGFTLFQDLLNYGFRCVDLIWTPSWYFEPKSLRKQANRYATAVRWVHTNYHSGGAFLVFGTSSGSAAVGYALTTWGIGDIADVAVCSGGPPSARLDLVCPIPPPPGWPAQCAQIVPANSVVCGQPACQISGPIVGAKLCTLCSVTPTATELLEDSVLHSTAQLSFPRTRLFSLLGTLDCTSAVPSSMLFFNAVTSERVVEFVPNTPHSLQDTAEGRDAIERALLGGAACLSGPASLEFQAWPQVGGTLFLDLNGPASTSYALICSLSQSYLEIPLGWVFLAPPVALLGVGPLDANGQATFMLGIPNDAAITNVDVFSQGLTGACMTNSIRFQVLP